MKGALLLIGIIFLGGCNKGEETTEGIITPFPKEPTEILVPSTQVKSENKSNQAVTDSDSVADPMDSAPIEIVDSEPADTPASAPTEIVDSEPADTPASAPTEIVDSDPADTPASIPADQTGTQPDTPAEDLSQPEVPVSNDDIANDDSNDDGNDDGNLDDSLDPDECGLVMISPNFALINFSCLPEQVKKNKGKACGKYLKVVFQTPNGKEKRSCKKVNIPKHVLEEDQVEMELEP